MNQQVAKLILIAVAVTGARGAQAFQFESTAASCPKSGETWVCSEAFTKVNIAEATTVDEVTVEAQFSGPNYFAQRWPRFFGHGYKWILGRAAT